MSQMNATERTALLDHLRLNDEMDAVIDERTIEILEHRRRTAVVRRRGWLVRRMLLLADIVGLTLAYVLAHLIFGDPATNGDHVRPFVETLLFVATLPVWIVVAKIYGLYDHDEERTDHSTADDLVGVFHMVTVGAWFVFVVGIVTRAAHPQVLRLALFWF